MRHRAFPIRISLVLLVLAAVLPALGLVALTGHSLRSAMVRSAESTALRQIQSMATQQQRVVEMARLLLTTLSRSSAVQDGDVSRCRNLLDEMRRRDGMFAALALTDRSGRVLVASESFAGALSASVAPAQTALRSTAFAMGAYHYLESGRRVGMEFAQPVIGGDGAVSGVLLALFDLDYFGRIFAGARYPQGSVFTLTDPSGMRLTRFPQADRYTWVPDLPHMVARMSGGSAEGTFLETGVDGVRRLYSYKRIHIKGAPFPYLMIRLGQPEDLALAEVRRVTRGGIIWMTLAGLLAVAVAWIMGDRLIVRRLNRLVAAAERLGTGNLHTRTGLDHDGSEPGILAEAFDRMAGRLEEYDRERRRAEQEVCILNQELEERVCIRTEELQTALENLRHAQQQLVMSEKLAALGGLVAGVAHEINTPVGVALSAASTMARKNQALSQLFTQGEMKRSDLSAYLADMAEGTDMTQLNLQRASDLIRSFKMVAADQVSETRRSFNCREYLGQVLLSLRPRLKKTTHEVEVVCADDLVVESYPGALSQILTNFIINSLTHAYTEGQSGHLRIELVREGDCLVLTYGDDGRGMTPQEQDKIFEPFYTTARARGSTGLGLHIVFNLVTATLGGTITCCSAPGQGTTFQVRIPLTTENA